MQALERQLEVVRNKLEGPIDFQGQELAEQWQKQILWSSGLVAFVVGLVLQSLQATLILFAAGFLACLAVTAPSYPSYNRDPITWLAPLSEFGLAPSERRKDR
ncbi:hypothetical protein JCM3766R1_004841 [Sporobolomyces carnicolor]